MGQPRGEPYPEHQCEFGGCHNPGLLQALSQYVFCFLCSLAPLWSVEELKGYILYVQRQYHPLLSPSAQLILTRYYQFVRTHNNSSAQATVRLLESLIRLGQAHARLMMRNEVMTMVMTVFFRGHM